VPNRNVQSMRAIQITEFGGPEVLQLVDLPVPEPVDGEVLIKVSRAGLNFADTHQRHDDYLAKASLPMVPGAEVAGVREDTGERVDVVFEMAGGQVFEESSKALAPFGRLVAYGIASREQNEVATGRLMRRSHAVVGFWLMHCLGRPAMVDEALADLFERVARG